MIDYKKILNLPPSHPYLSSAYLEYSLVLITTLKEQNLKFKSILEFGSAGYHPRSLSRFGGRNLYAFQEFYPGITIEGNDIACPKEGVEIDGIKIKQGDIYKKLPYKNKSFDLVLISGMLAHVNDTDTEQAIKNALRIAKKYIIIIDLYTKEKVEIGISTLSGRNYKSYFPDKRIESEEMPKYMWPGNSYPFPASILTIYL